MVTRDFYEKFETIVVGPHGRKNPKRLNNDYFEAKDGTLIYCPDSFFADLYSNSFQSTRLLLYGKDVQNGRLREEKNKFIDSLEEILRLLRNGETELEEFTYGVFNEKAIRKYLDIAISMDVSDREGMISKLNHMHSIYLELNSAYDEITSDEKRIKKRIESMDRQLARK